MKALFQILNFLFMSAIIYSQSLIVHINNGTVQSFNISEIDSITFTTSQQFVCGTSQVTYESKTYNTVLIGEQCWLKENLDVGTMIQVTQNQTNNGTIEKYCYNDSVVNCNLYGGLYQWNETMQYVTTEGTQGICPTGWHIPTLAEFQTLAASVNNDGNALKREDQGSGAGQGTNTSGFSALLAGCRYDAGYFYFLGIGTYFWSSTEFNASDAGFLSLSGDQSGFGLGLTPKDYGFSVRCVKD